MSDISSLPVDVWLSIFQKSEAKTLGVCKCVCKDWCKIISSPNFINYHLNLSYSSPSSSLTNLRRLRRRSKEAIQSFPFSSMKSHDFIAAEVGLSGGIYCFRVVMKEEEEGHYSKWRVMLWNPAIRKCMVLLTVDFGAGFSRLIDGFGFEPVSNDYKFVMVSESTLKPQHSPQMVHVYSTARGDWRSFPFTTNLPHLRFVRSAFMIACVNGVMYWKIPAHGIDQAVDKYGEVMLTFNVRKEEFRILELPEEELEELEEDMCSERGVFENCNQYNMESLLLWDKQAKPTPWSRGVSVIQAENFDIESTY